MFDSRHRVDRCRQPSPPMLTLPRQELMELIQCFSFLLPTPTHRRIKCTPGHLENQSFLIPGKEDYHQARGQQRDRTRLRRIRDHVDADSVDLDLKEQLVIRFREAEL